MTNLPAQCIWDRDPLEVREQLNQSILMIEAKTPSVFSVADRVVQSESRDTPVRIYHPNDQANLPLILLIHGGAWVAGNLDTHDNLARYLCSETEAIVVSVGYTNAPEGKFPLPLEQCYDTLTWMRDFFKDSSRLAIVGDSAGANMAAALCMMARDRSGPKIDLQVLINPAPDLSCNGTIERQNDALDILRWQAFHYLPHPSDAKNGYVSPLLAEDLTQLPRAVVILAEQDELKEDGQRYADRLLDSGVPTLTFCQIGTGHLAGQGARAAPPAVESLSFAVSTLKTLFSNL